RGHHTWKMGGELDRQHSPNHFLPSINGGFTFNSVGTTNAFSQFIRNASNCPAGSTCSQLSLTDGPFNFDFAEYDASFYGQDDWRIKDNLTLNLGLRWEWNQQAVNLLHDRTVAFQAGANPLWDNTFPASETTVPIIPQDFNNFSPVVGFAWTPRMGKGLFGEDKTVLRGGFRISYDPTFYNMFLNVATSSPSVNAVTTVAPLPSSGNFTGADILPFLQSGGFVGTAGINPGIRNH